MNTLALLRNYVSEGYLLHGSRHKFDKVEIKQARCGTQRVGGSENGVYATTEVRVSIVLAVLHPTNPKDWHRSYRYEDHGMFEIRGYNFCLKPGYIYVLPRDTFRSVCIDDPTEFVSPVAVIPVTMVKVEPELLNLYELKIDLMPIIRSR